MECVVEQIVPVGNIDERPACDLILARVVRFHIDESIYENGYILPDRLKPVGRMAGSDYARLGSMFSLERPS
ncbi:hypothetical protein D3C84_1063100 [compost metagenome]